MSNTMNKINFAYTTQLFENKEKPYYRPIIAIKNKSGYLIDNKLPTGTEKEINKICKHLNDINGINEKQAIEIVLSSMKF